MDLKQETRQIGGLEITVIEFAAWDAFELLPRLGTIGGPLLAAAGGDLKAGLSVLPQICQMVTKDKDLLLDLLKNTTVNKDGTIFSVNTKEKINAVFSGNLWAMLETLKMSLEVSFTDFLSQAMNALGDLDLGQNEEGEKPSE